MPRIIVLILAIILTSCSTTPTPKPVPACDMTVAGKCRDMSAGETAGAGVRGHGEDTKNER